MTFEERAKELVSKMTLGEKVAQMLYNAPSIERLGIPAYNWWNEGLHGVARAGTATVFPQAIGLAATFNDNLIYNVSTAISDEARAKYNAFKKQGDTDIILSDNLPDLITFSLEDINILKAVNSINHLEFSKDDELFKNINKDILNFHNNTKGKLDYIPGGFSDSDEFNLSKEGVYIYKKALDNASVKSISSFENLYSFIEEYINSKRFQEITNILSVDEDGFETLEHLFGITPSLILKINRESGDISDYSKVANVFQNLNKSGITNVSFHTPDSLPLIYIGNSSKISCFNIDCSKNYYKKINIYGEKNGYLSKYSRFGSYATFVVDQDNRDDALLLIKNLISEETSKDLICGEKNTDWIYDSKINKLIPLEDTVRKFSEGDLNIINKGISVFPYLSTFSPIYPFINDEEYIKKDILKEKMSLLKNPTTEPGKTYFLNRNYVNNIYLSIISKNK